MNAGVLGIVDGAFEFVESFVETTEEDDYELTTCLDVRRVFSLPSGATAFAGRAVEETLTTREEVAVELAEVCLEPKTEVATKYTEFVGVPGEFVVVGSGTGSFALDLLADETETTIERATVDLDSFYDGLPGARPWKAGFRGAESDLNGVFHGDDLRTDDRLNGLFTDASLNQLGLEYGYEDETLKMMASRSGYVEVYQPAGFSSTDFLCYLDDQISRTSCEVPEQQKRTQAGGVNGRRGASDRSAPV